MRCPRILRTHWYTVSMMSPDCLGYIDREVLCIGEKDTCMGKPDLLKLTKTMLTDKAVGE